MSELSAPSPRRAAGPWPLVPRLLCWPAPRPSTGYILLRCIWLSLESPGSSAISSGSSSSCLSDRGRCKISWPPTPPLMNVAMVVSGSLDHVSATAGLALYRIAQESLANIAKHAPDSPTRMTLTASRTAATLTVVNDIQEKADARIINYGRGLSGMQQRI